MRKMTVFISALVVCCIILPLDISASPVVSLRSETAPHQCLDQICFEQNLEFKGQKFQLQGIAARSHLKFFKVYTGAFYLPEGSVVKTDDVPSGAKLMVLEYHRHIAKDKIIQSIAKNIEENPSVDGAQLSARFKQLSSAFSDPNKGSRFLFAFIPGNGTYLVEGDEIQTEIKGDDFAYAFFGIWFSKHTGNQQRRSQFLNI